MTRYTKAYRPVPDQLALLEGRGMTIPDRQKAEEYLGRLGYYRLSGYWFPFRETRVVNGQTTVLDTFKPGTSFKTVLDLYAFDKTLRLQLLDVLERIDDAHAHCAGTRAVRPLGPSGASVPQRSVYVLRSAHAQG